MRFVSMFYGQPQNDDAKRTVTLSSNDLRAARRLLQLLLGGNANDQLSLEPPTRPAEDKTRGALIARAQEEFGKRRRRLAFFRESMFGEAAWDMLLALYILDVSGQRQTVGSLLHFSGASATTAKRWLTFLEGNGLVRRDPHPTDRRLSFVGLTEKAREKLDLYYSETITSGV